MKSNRRFIPDLIVLAVLLLIPLLLFLPVTLGNRTLIPTDNLFQWAPWKSLSEEYQVSSPHNELISDLLLENLVWKRFILTCIEEREIPLWNPYIFAGTPFFASGQHSAFYPFNLIFYVFPLTRAYGIFAVSQLFLAGAFMYLFGRVLGMKRTGAALAGVTYQLCAYLFVSITFPMILAGSVWIPFILAMIELAVQQHPALGKRPATLPWIVFGAVGLGMQLMVGHGENSYFTLLVMGFYSAWRLAALYLSETKRLEKANFVLKITTIGRPAGWLVILVVLGFGLGAAQFIPFVELVPLNFREGAASLADLLRWSFPLRRIITFLAPNFFGNPSHHSYLDIFNWQTNLVNVNALGEPVIKIDWGIKNYVEGGVYLGILPLLLAVFAVWQSLKRINWEERVHIWFFALLSLASLAFIFPTGAYAIIHAIPIINQSHSPFRWVFPLSISVAVLAGWGACALERPENKRILSLLAAAVLGGGLLGIAGLVVCRSLYDRLTPFIERLFWELALAPSAFPDARAFFSYEWLQLLIAAVFIATAGIILQLALHKVRWWKILAILVVAVDLAVATWNFYPQADPSLLDIKPDLIQFLESQPGTWRLTTFTPHGDMPLHANTPWLYEIQDVRGYDSIILMQYARYMGAIEKQEELLYNRVQPIKHWESLNSPLLDLLNVKYIVSSEQIDLPKLAQVWNDGELIVYENLAAAPRAFTLPLSTTIVSPDPLPAMSEHDPRSFVFIEPDAKDTFGIQESEPKPVILSPAEIVEYGSQQVTINATAIEPSWLVLADSYYPGWKAFARPLDCADCEETALEIARVDGNFRGVLLDPGTWAVRFKYSPLSFKIGLFTSFLAGATVLFSIGVWLWRFAYKEGPNDTSIRRVAKNSLAPMCLNLFNRTIDFALAALAMRILGAENAGKYYVAINIAGWFEILANFGLNTLLTREVAKDKSAANRYLVNTTILRFITSLVAAVPIALYILTLGTSSNPLANDTTLAIVLIMIGMIPGGINTGLTALFYAFEKAEIPAALSTVSTILKVSLQAAALLTGMGLLGLAAVSIVVNLVTMVLLGTLAFKTFFVPHKEMDWGLQKEMVGESFPLMINHLLATFFFKVDVLLLERLGGVGAVNGNIVVGWYSTAYKWVEALNIIPSFFTIAIFPFLSRQAQTARESMKGTYELAIKLLVMFALPVAVLTTAIATLLVSVLGGAEYLPHGAIALRILIWSIPIGWINSITNYVLIALGQQHKLTRAFMLGVAFNLSANIIFLPRFSYPAAAVIAILSELVLLAAFYYYLRKALAPIPWLKLFWRPVAATAAMAGVTWVGWQIHWSLGITAGILVYVGSLSILGALSQDERKLLAKLLPESVKNSRFRRWIPS